VVRGGERVRAAVRETERLGVLEPSHDAARVERDLGVIRQVLNAPRAGATGERAERFVLHPRPRERQAVGVVGGGGAAVGTRFGRRPVGAGVVGQRHLHLLDDLADRLSERLGSVGGEAELLDGPTRSDERERARFFELGAGQRIGRNRVGAQRLQRVPREGIESELEGRLATDVERTGDEVPGQVVRGRDAGRAAEGERRAALARPAERERVGEARGPVNASRARFDRGSRAQVLGAPVVVVPQDRGGHAGGDEPREGEAPPEGASESGGTLGYDSDRVHGGLFVESRHARGRPTELSKRLAPASTPAETPSRAVVTVPPRGPTTPLYPGSRPWCAHVGSRFTSPPRMSALRA
jgi:hypothetical protein